MRISPFFQYVVPVMLKSFEYLDKGQHKVMASNELMVLECPSVSEDGLDFDYSDVDPTINYKHLVR